MIANPYFFQLKYILLNEGDIYNGERNLDHYFDIISPSCLDDRDSMEPGKAYVFYAPSDVI